MRQMILIATLVSASVSVIGAESTLTWTETQYAVVTSNHTRSLNSFTALEAKTHNWNVSVANSFYVTGSSTHEPAWRMLFANLCTNDWFATANFSCWLNNGETVTSKEDYYSQSCYSSFQQGETTATRYLEDRITVNLYYTVTQSGGG